MGRGREETIDKMLIKRNLHLVQRLSRLTGKDFNQLEQELLASRPVPIRKEKSCCKISSGAEYREKNYTTQSSTFVVGKTMFLPTSV